MDIDPLKTPVQNMFSLIVGTNPGSGVNSTNVTLGAPANRTPDANPNDTTIVVSPILGKGFKGDPVPMTYNRLALNQSVSSPILNYEVQANDSAAAAALLITITTNLGLVAGEFNFTNVSNPLGAVSPGAAAVAVGLSPKAGSYLYNAGVSVNVHQEYPGQRFGLTRFGAEFGAYPS